MHTQWMTERTKLKLRPPCISRHKLLPVSVKHTYNLRLVRKWWGRERLISTQACSTGTKVIIITNEHARTRTHTHTEAERHAPFWQEMWTVTATMSVLQYGDSVLATHTWRKKTNQWAWATTSTTYSKLRRWQHRTSKYYKWTEPKKCVQT